jgi:hypothetical protein
LRTCYGCGREFVPRESVRAPCFGARHWDFEQTPFDKKRVMLPAKIAGKIGYKNPDPPARSTTSVAFPPAHSRPLT